MNGSLKKIVYACFAVYFVLSIIGGAILQSRLERSMAECGQYREQLAAAENRESEVRAVVNRTGLILDETTTSIGELREKLKEVEDCYNCMWQLFYDDDDTIHNEKEVNWKY